RGSNGVSRRHSDRCVLFELENSDRGNPGLRKSRWVGHVQIEDSCTNSEFPQQPIRPQTPYRWGSRWSIDELKAADRPASGRQRRRSIDRQCIGGLSTANGPIRKTGLSTVFIDHR
ncbi:hypothetical protein CROQUDRAFT_100875, partial [Cronartium quercuum f. sp. fusiforme G11]